MTKERWEKIKAMVEDRFDNINHSTQELDDGSGGTQETIEFVGPLGLMKLVFVTKPKFLGEKTTYSNRIGGSVAVEKKYDSTETVSFMNAYKQNTSGEWEQMSADMFEE